MCKENVRRRKILNNEFMKKKRKLIGKTHEDVARDLNIKPQTYSLWERGVVQPLWGVTISPETLVDYFGCTDDELFSYEEINVIDEDNFFDGTILKDKRNSMGLTVKELAERFNNISDKPISCSSIRKYESNKRKPSTETLEILEDIFGCMF